MSRYKLEEVDYEVVRYSPRFKIIDSNIEIEDIEREDGSIAYLHGIDEDAAKSIVEALERQLKDKWIPVSERLPNMEEYNQNDGRFIVTDGNRRYQSLFDIYQMNFFVDIIYKGNCNFEEMVDDKVIAWKHMPEPYQSLKKEKYIDELEEKCPCMSEESLNCGMKCSRYGREL